MGVPRTMSSDAAPHARLALTIPRLLTHVKTLKYYILILGSPTPFVSLREPCTNSTEKANGKTLWGQEVYSKRCDKLEV
jgi:hypothetical protein